MRACGDGNLSSTWVSQVSSMGWGLIPIYVGPRRPASTRRASAPSTRRRPPPGQGRRCRRGRARAFFGLGAGTPRLLRHGGVRPHVVRLHGDGPVVPDGVDAGAARPRLHVRRVRQQRLAHGRPVHGDGHDGIHRTRQRVVRQLERAADPVRLDESPRVPGQLLGRRPAAPPVRHRQRDVGRGAGSTSTPTGSAAASRARRSRSATAPTRPAQAARRSSSPATCPTGSRTRARACRDAPTPPTPTAAPRRTAPHRPRALSAGLYAVSAYVPATRADAKVAYAVSDARGSATTVVDQSTRLAAGLRSAPISPAPGPRCGSTPATTVRAQRPAQVGVDAMRFTLVATAPSAPTSVSAVPDNGRATVRWSAATVNGSPVTGYTVTASPAGATPRCRARPRRPTSQGCGTRPPTPSR